MLTAFPFLVTFLIYFLSAKSKFNCFVSGLFGIVILTVLPVIVAFNSTVLPSSS